MLEISPMNKLCSNCIPKIKQFWTRIFASLSMYCFFLSLTGHHNIMVRHLLAIFICLILCNEIMDATSPQFSLRISVTVSTFVIFNAWRMFHKQKQCQPSYLRNPISETENGFLEPKL